MNEREAAEESLSSLKVRSHRVAFLAAVSKLLTHVFPALNPTSESGRPVRADQSHGQHIAQHVSAERATWLHAWTSSLRAPRAQTRRRGPPSSVQLAR